MAWVLFPFGVRLSTWLAILAFAGLAIARKDWRPLLAGWAWITGWEATFQVFSLAFGRLPVGPDGPIFYIILGCVTVPFAARHGARPSLPILACAVGLLVLWLATGFHVNGHTTIGFDPTAEALNEAAKTLWAVAYLWPLVKRERRPHPKGDSRWRQVYTDRGVAVLRKR